jgi:hypothetical protein
MPLPLPRLNEMVASPWPAAEDVAPPIGPAIPRAHTQLGRYHSRRNSGQTQSWHPYQLWNRDELPPWSIAACGSAKISGEQFLLRQSLNPPPRLCDNESRTWWAYRGVITVVCREEYPVHSWVDSAVEQRANEKFLSDAGNLRVRGCLGLDLGAPRRSLDP